MPTKKMILTQNLAFNLPLCAVMTATASIVNHFPCYLSAVKT